MQRGSRERTGSEVLVLGAGFTGCTAAVALHRVGLPVRLLDQQPDRPLTAFRAEKIEPDQARGLADLGVLGTGADSLLDAAPRIDRVVSHRDGRIESRDYPEPEFGVTYRDMVDHLRRQAEREVGIERCRVERLVPRGGRLEVHTRDGVGPVTSRLCVLASGSRTLLRRSGIEVAADDTLTSLTVGFDVVGAGVQAGGPGATAPAFTMPAFNVYADDPFGTGIQYATFFPLKHALRCNVFTSWEGDEPRLAEMLRDPVATLQQLLPQLAGMLGPIERVGPVSAARTAYHRVGAPAVDGVVVLGEAFQSVSPATGLGLSKCLNDVRVLLRHVSGWPASGLVPRALVAAFQADPEKVALDDEARDCWRWFHDSATSRSLPWRLRRSSLWRMVRRRLARAGSGAGGAVMGGGAR